VDVYTEQIDRCIAEGCRNAAEVYRELAVDGFTGSADAVLRFFNRRQAAAGQKRERAKAAAPNPPAPPSARKLSFDFIRRPAKRRQEEQQRLDHLRSVAAELSEALQLSDEFVAMVRQRAGTELADWLTRAAEAEAPEVHGFAGGIRQDRRSRRA
jgi:transposase